MNSQRLVVTPEGIPCFVFSLRANVLILSLVGSYLLDFLPALAAAAGGSKTLLSLLSER
jgi:hypothetical protein